MRKEHAEHNERVCDHLLKSEEFYDWAVTTAFYSALHYVQYEIFPCEISGIDFESFDDYFGSRLKNNGTRIDKHKETINLVQIHFYNAYTSYKWLFDACMSARYHDYKVSDKKAEAARARLTQIKAFMKKET